MNILFSCVGRRKYLLDYFREEIKNNGRIVGTDMTHTAPALSSCDSWYEVPAIYSPEYIDKLIDICIKEKISVLISLNDMELPILAKNKSKFKDIGVNVIVSNEDIINICSDKWATIKFAEQHSIPTPKSFLSVESAAHAIKEKKVHFPLIVKPRWGSASFGLFVVNKIENLEEAFKKCTEELKESYLSNFAQGNDIVLIQEYIEGSEYGLDIFNDLDGNYHGVICKKKLSMRAGETDKATTIINEKLSTYAKQIGSKLAHIGNMDCDFLEKNGQFYLLELNPRFGGGYPFSHEAGGNLVKALLQSLQGQTQEIDISYVPNLTFAKCDTIIPARLNP